MADGAALLLAVTAATIFYVVRERDEESVAEVPTDEEQPQPVGEIYVATIADILVFDGSIPAADKDLFWVRDDAAGEYNLCIWSAKLIDGVPEGWLKCRAIDPIVIDVVGAKGLTGDIGPPGTSSSRTIDQTIPLFGATVAGTTVVNTASAVVRQSSTQGIFIDLLVGFVPLATAAQCIVSVVQGTTVLATNGGLFSVGTEAVGVEQFQRMTVELSQVGLDRDLQIRVGVRQGSFTCEGVAY